MDSTISESEGIAVQEEQPEMEAHEIEAGVLTPLDLPPIEGTTECFHNRDPATCELCRNPFYDHIWKIINVKNRNVLMLVEGPPGTGKSYVSMRIAEAMDPGFTAENLHERMIFEPKQFLKLLNQANPTNPDYVEGKLYRGAVIVLEEFGVQDDHRKWYSFNNSAISYILQTFRFMNLIVIFNVPIAEYVDSDARKMFQFHVETLDIDTSEERSHTKIKEQFYNSTFKKIFKRYLRYRINSEWLKFRFWDFKKPPAKIWHRYEDLHREFKYGLQTRLYSDMAEIEKSNMDKKRKNIDTDDAVNFVLNNRDRFITVHGGRVLVDPSLVENHFGVGRFTAIRIKKVAEKKMELNGENVVVKKKRASLIEKIKRRPGGVPLNMPESKREEEPDSALNGG